MIKGMAGGTGIGPARMDRIRGQGQRFLRQSLWKNGRLLVTYKNGRAHLNAYLDDHAFLLDALLELMQAGSAN